MMLFGLLAFIFIIIAVVYFLSERGQGNTFSAPVENKSALDIARERYARGEITKEEFERLRHDLSSR